MNAGGTLWLLVDVGLVVVLAAGLIYGISQWRRRTPRERAVSESATKQLYEKGDPSDADAQVTLVPGDHSVVPGRGQRITEDDAAKAALGGARGAPDLESAKLTRQSAAQIPKALDPGHTA